MSEQDRSLSSGASRTGIRASAGLLVVGLGIMSAPLDSSVNIAFPFITRAFDAPLESIQWVVIRLEKVRT